MDAEEEIDETDSDFIPESDSDSDESYAPPSKTKKLTSSSSSSLVKEKSSSSSSSIPPQSSKSSKKASSSDVNKSTSSQKPQKKGFRSSKGKRGFERLPPEQRSKITVGIQFSTHKASIQKAFTRASGLKLLTEVEKGKISDLLEKWTWKREMGRDKIDKESFFKREDASQMINTNLGKLIKERKQITFNNATSGVDIHFSPSFEKSSNVSSSSSSTSKKSKPNKSGRESK